MQSMENDRAVFHPSHSRLEDADEARVSHIPTTTATRLDKKDKQLRLLHPSIGLFSSMRLPGGSFRQCDLALPIGRTPLLSGNRELVLSKLQVRHDAGTLCIWKEWLV